MHSPIVKPVVATPRSQLKRKHGEIVDLTEDEQPRPSTCSLSQANGGARESTESTVERQLGDSEFSEDDDDDSMLEDALDTIELAPYLPRKLCRQFTSQRT